MKKLILLIAMLGAAPLYGQVALQNWLTTRIEGKVAARETAVNKLEVETNSNRAIRQKDAPSADSRSTSLVDQSSATDFVSMALALTPATSSSSANDTGGNGVVTATAYSLLALLNKTELTDPAFYKAHTMARQISFSLGSTASDQAKDNTTDSGTTIGFKYTFLNEREIYSKRNQMLLSKVQEQLSKSAAVEVKVRARVLALLVCAQNPNGITGVSAVDLASFCESGVNKANPPGPLNTAIAPVALMANDTSQFTTLIESMPESVIKKVDSLIDANMESFGALRDIIDSTYDQIKQGRQLAFSATFINRPGQGTDDYRTSVVYDYGLSPSINWTVNASFDYRNRTNSFDSRGGRFATEFLGRLTDYGDGLWGHQPITISFSGEGKWLTQQLPQYSIQAKVTIPVGAGINVPIIYRWSKRIDLLDEQGKELKLGLSVDFGSLAQVLKSK